MDFKVCNRFIFIWLHVWILNQSVKAGKTLGMARKSSVANFLAFSGPQDVKD